MVFLRLTKFCLDQTLGMDHARTLVGFVTGVGVMSEQKVVADRLREKKLRDVFSIARPGDIEAEAANRGVAVFLPPETTVATAARKMAAADVATVVVKDGADFVGVVTTREITLKVIGAGLDPETTKLSAIMKSEMAALSPEAPVIDALHMMQRHGHRYIPIKQGQSYVGIISLYDLFMAVALELEADVEERDRYLSGSYAR